jgi:hypothetical protein
MTNISINEMIDQEFEEFEQDRNKRKNIKGFLNFAMSELNYNEQSFNISELKFKKKLTTSVYVKGNNNNQLF